jgi:methionyl-tRNA synthetase
MPHRVNTIMEKQKYLITAALPYANGPMHIGHLAGCHLPADIFARYQRMHNHDVIFICGTDEHGVPITIAARKENSTPQAIADKYHEIIDKALFKFGISFDNFSRTSSKLHKETASDFFTVLYQKNLLIEQEEEQYFDKANNRFLADRYIIGTCPKCGNDKAYGDQCESCGSTLSPRDLINPRNNENDSPLELKLTKHWYIPLQDYEPWLKEWILNDHKDWKTNVYGQCKSWLDAGLQPRAVTRDLDWGVPVPLPNTAGKVLYVWFDAPIGYITATKELTPNWKDYWCNKNTKLIHFLGKDNIVFHCIIFPTMLKMHGGFILPEQVPANEFLNLEGNKISTSRNWAVWLHEYLEDFPEQQDVLRYVLAANAPETKDNDFTWKEFQDRCNSELVAILGNFFNRTLVLAHKFCNGKIPPLHKNLLDEVDNKLIPDMLACKAKIEASMQQYRFREALAEVMNVARLGNKYLTEKEPWKKVNGDVYIGSDDFEALQNKQKVENCLHLCIQLSANLAILMYPFIPFTAKKILMHFNINKRANEMLLWENIGKTDMLKIGYTINQPVLLFKKIEDEEITFQMEKLHAKKVNIETENKKVPAEYNIAIKPEISFEDFAKLDCRVGTIISAEKVPKADKLLKLTVDIGIEKRTVVSGIASHYLPENIIGQQVMLLCNLAPRKMKGIESQGMILMAEESDGKLVFMQPKRNTLNNSLIS